MVAIAFGILAFTRPRQAIQALVLLFSAYALVDGAPWPYSLASASLHTSIDGWW